MDSIKTTDINETQGLPIVEPTSFLGYKFNVDVSTQQALELAKLDYEIGFEQSDKIPSFIDLFVDDNGNKKYFHSTRNSYKVVQNRDLAKQIDDLTAQFPNAKWSTMGKVHEVNGIGTTIFMTKRVEELDILVDGDRTETYIFGQTSHNSRTAFSLGIMFNRIFCSNQLPSVMANGNLVNRKHTDRIFDNLRASKKVFELGLQNSQIMNKVGNDLALKKATIDDKYTLLIISYRKRKLDKDNLYTGCKSLIDACVQEDLIFDDSPDYVDLKVEQYTAKEEHTMVIRKKVIEEK